MKQHSETLAIKALQRKEVHSGPSEYLFDSGTSGTCVWCNYYRAGDIGCSQTVPFFPGSIWNLSFINNYTFYKAEESSYKKYIYIKEGWKKAVEDGYHERQSKIVSTNSFS